MDYYLMFMDDRLQNIVNFKNYSSKCQEEAGDIVLLEEIPASAKICDYIISRSFTKMHHIVSDKVKSIFDLYDVTMETRTVFLTDTTAKQQFHYWEIMPETIDCIEDKKNIKSLKLNKTMMEGTPAFQIKIDMATYMVIRFDMAESILRRNPLGISFQKAETV